VPLAYQSHPPKVCRPPSLRLAQAAWDCSCFGQYIYGKHGISLPHNTTASRTSGKIIGAQNPSVGTVIREADSPYGPLMGYYTLKK
jgi:peptidoglycan DL-endopeptidase CwlO